jgi:glycosyltransferase involved in cell wall biosynthesis
METPRYTAGRDHSRDGPWVIIGSDLVTGDSALPNARLPTTVSGISIVVPVFRSAASLRELHERLTLALSKTTDRYEIILVEDSGGDASWSEIVRLAGVDPHVRGISMTRNFGQHNALLCGIRAAVYEVIVTLDDDLQNPPEEISKLLARLDDEVDVVYGSPEVEQHGTRDLGSRNWPCRVR